MNIRSPALRRTTAWMLCAGAALAQAQPLMPSPPRADDPEATTVPALLDGSQPHEDQPRWVLGMAVSSGPSRAGGGGREWGLRPVLAGHVGRWMLATSSARHWGGGGQLAGGLSTQWDASDRWRVGMGIRLTHGRDSDGDPLLAGLPGVSPSLALRMSAQYALSDRWKTSLGWQQDLTHGQGGRAVLGLGWQYPLSHRWTLDAGAGLTWANARAMTTFYGVPASLALPQRPAWWPGAGWEQWQWAVGASQVIDRHWRLSFQLGQGRLLGQAAASPLTTTRLSSAGQVTVAYVGW